MTTPHRKPDHADARSHRDIDHAQFRRADPDASRGRRGEAARATFTKANVAQSRRPDRRPIDE